MGGRYDQCFANNATFGSSIVVNVRGIALFMLHL